MMVVFIEMLGGNPARTRVKLNGHDVTDNLRSLNLEIDAQSVPKLTLEYIVDDIFVQGKAGVIKRTVDPSSGDMVIDATDLHERSTEDHSELDVDR